MVNPKPFSDRDLQRLLAGLGGSRAFVFLESIRLTPEDHCSYLFMDPVDRLVCNAEDDPADFFRRARECLQQGFFLAGYIAYEFGYLLEPSLAGFFAPRRFSGSITGGLPLADLGVFRAPHIHDHMSAAPAAIRSWPTGPASASGPGFRVDNLRLNLEREEYLRAVNRIKSYIASGDTYQVNYTLKLLFDFSGSIAGFYCSLRRNQSVAYGGLIKTGDTTILSFSPEMFFRKKGQRINVRPMKGTMHRGRTLAEDREFADFLHHDIKNRSENVMIVDLLRNDLGRLSRMGGVSVQSLFDVETYETLHQMTSSIRGELDRPVSLQEMFTALFPCGSVTGAPKIRTMEIIRELEAEDRGIYTGALGFITPAGDAVFNVPIRTVVLQGNRGEMGIGSGIVWDSDPEGEWEECRLKGRFLTTPAPEFALIETMLYHPGSGYWLLDLHLDRLVESALYFAYPLEPEDVRAALSALAMEFAGATTQQNRRVRLTLARSGVLEITHAELSSASPPEVDLKSMLQQKEPGNLPKVILSDRKTDSRSPYLFHKTTLRRLYDEERARLVEGRGYYEVLFENEKGEVTEGSYANIFLQRGNRLITPPVSCGLLPGVLRKHLLQQYPDLVVEQTLSREDLEEAEALYVGNSVRGLVRVKLARAEG